MPLQVQIVKSLPNSTLDVSFACGDEPTSILGPSGAGKSMLLRCIAGIEKPDSGRIVLSGRALFDSRERVDLPARDRHVGMLFQNYALFPHLTVAQNVAFGLGGVPRGDQDQRVDSAMHAAHAHGLEDRYPRELSGGEQQRVALARALAVEPEALLLDEPLSALDTHLRSQIEALLQETFASYARPALVVTHNIEEAYRIGRQLMVLSGGRIAAFGNKEEIFRRPNNLEVARLTGCKNFSRARRVSELEIEAIDWGCRLTLPSADKGSVAYVGLRAHHVVFPDAAQGSQQNVFPCWPVRSSETPFRVTLYLHLHKPPNAGDEPTLQAEVFKEKWEQFRFGVLPWYVQLPPDMLFTLPG